MCIRDRETNERERYSGFRVSVQAENCLHRVPEVSEFQEDLLRISVRVKPSQNYRQGLVATGREGMVLQVLNLQDGLDQAVGLEPTDDNRVTAKQLKVKSVGRQSVGRDQPPV